MLSEENSFKLVAELIERGARIVISQHPGCAQKIEIDASIYTRRHLTENFFCKLKSSNASACVPARPIAASKL